MRAVWLADVIRDAGLTIRFYPGWETRGADTFNPKGIILHHTVTRPNLTAEDRLLAIQGNSTTPPPLCNISTNRDGSVSIIAAGVANHGGKGSWKGVAGNRFFLGDEMKNLGSGNPASAYYEPWPEIQLESARRAAAAILSHIGRDASWMCGHKEYRGALLPRKVDPHTLDMNDERARIALLMATGPGNMEDDMWQYLNIDESLVRHASEQGWYKLPDGSPDRSEKTLNYWLANLTKLQEAVAPPGFDVDWLAWRRAVTNGIARGGAQGPPGADGKNGADGADGTDGVSEATVKEIITATRLNP